MTDIRDVHVIAPNFKRRLSGVTSTIIQLVPVQRRLGQNVAALGPGLLPGIPHVRFRDLWRLWQRPRGAPLRVWHARRNNEMLFGILLKYVLRMRLKLLFTSASQRKHSRWTRFLISKVDDVVSTSSKTAAYLERKSHVVLHGIATERFFPADDKVAAKTRIGLPQDQKIAGCFGRIRKQKGTDLFVDAMIRLLPDRPDWMAIIAGRTTSQHSAFEAELKDRIARANLSSRILFVGEHPDIPDWYRGLDLFIAPQRWEGFGLTPLEAMACAVPVVATDVGAFSELIPTDLDPNPGVIVETGIDGLAEGARRFMDDDQHRAAASATALAHARGSFALENEANALGRIYRQLLGI